MFSDPSFDMMVENGGSISVSKGKNVFGDIGVTSSDPTLRVALDDCKLSTSSWTNGDINDQLLIKDG